MQYRAKVTFADLKDNKRLYLAGSIYPREGLKVTYERLAELASSDNPAGFPLIELIAEQPLDTPEQPSKRKTRKRVEKDA